MVKTSDGVLDINPLERMEKLKEINEERKNSISAKKQELEELERKKKKEIEELDKKKKKELEELDSKKKELEELEKKKVQDIDETEALIEKSFQDLMRHKRKIIHDEDEERQSKSQNIADLTEEAPKITAQQVNYGKFFENLETPKRLYEVANGGFYSNLMDLRNKAATGEISPEEERFIDNLRNQFEQFEKNSEYIENKDKNNYVKRSMNNLDQIDQYVVKHR